MSNMFAGLMILESGLSSDISVDIRNSFTKFPKFYVRKDKENRAVFYNENKEWFCKTSPVIKCEKHSNGYIKLVTSSGHSYNLTIAKTKKSITSKLEVISKNKTTKSINYGNGYNKTEFVFNHEITKDEFTQFCIDNGYKIHKADGWWDCYSEVSGSGCNWTYTWVLVYTD